MDRNYIQDKRFEKEDIAGQQLLIADYENCTFVNCDFGNKDLAERVFLDCQFISSNLSSAKLHKTAFKSVKFKGCKLLGLRFEDCDSFLFEVDFDNCLLNLSSFYKVKMKNTTFKTCNLSEVDFTETNLTNAVFDNCDLINAKFENTVLEKADLRTAINYSIDPEINKIRKARFSIQGIAGLLDKYDIEID